MTTDRQKCKYYVQSKLMVCIQHMGGSETGRQRDGTVTGGPGGGKSKWNSNLKSMPWFTATSNMCIITWYCCHFSARSICHYIATYNPKIKSQPPMFLSSHHKRGESKKEKRRRIKTVTLWPSGLQLFMAAMRCISCRMCHRSSAS